MVVQKNPDGTIPKDPKYVLTLGESITAKEVNRRTDRIKEVELENQYNMDFNPKTNSKILKQNRGVGLDQVFEIENTIIEPDPKIKNLSVVKIRNIEYNMYISTDIKRLDGEGDDNEGGDDRGGGDAGGAPDQGNNNLLMNQSNDLGGGGFADETQTQLD